LAETKLLDLAEQNSEVLETVIIKAALVVGKEKPIPEWVLGVSRNAIRVDELAAAMLDVALYGKGLSSDTIGNVELRRRGRVILGK
jgi:hypothetical protein